MSISKLTLQNFLEFLLFMCEFFFIIKKVLKKPYLIFNSRIYLFILLKHKYFQDYYAVILEINFPGEIQSYSAGIWGIKIIWLDDCCIQAI